MFKEFRLKNKEKCKISCKLSNNCFIIFKIHKNKTTLTFSLRLVHYLVK